MHLPSATAALYSSAMPCDSCFGEGSPVARALVDLPQPRWVGPAYAESKTRIAVLALNPGAGSSGQEDGNLKLAALLHSFRNRAATFSDVLDYQAQHMPTWGKTPGRHINFYTGVTGHDLNELAFLNVALCATRGNRYPPAVLETCFRKHTSGLLQSLVPSIVLLSGSAVHKYARRIEALLPTARVEPILHYAHREGRDREQQEFKRVRSLIEQVSAASGA